MTALVAYHLIVGLLLVGLGLQVLANRRLLLRLLPHPPPQAAPTISVLIPARDEADRIAGCVRAWTRQVYPSFEVLVYDDESSDGTAERATAAGGDEVQVLAGSPLPPGWRGKPHACHRLRQEARGELLVFADADVTPAPGTLAGTAAALADTGADALSALPLHTGPGLLVQAVASIQNWAALTLLPTWLGAASRRSTFAALNGQFLVIRADVYDRVGGFRAVRGSLAEDTALGRLLVARGSRVRLLDGSRQLVCQPYSSCGQAWRANVRNLVPIFFGSAALLAAALAGVAALYLVPWLLLAVGALQGGGHGWLALGLPSVEIALAIGPRRLSDAFFGYSWRVTLLHPAAVACLVAMGVVAIFRYRLRRPVAWRGRSYQLGDEPAEIWH